MSARMHLDSHPTLDAAFDRIEGTILPSVGAALAAMLHAAEGGAGCDWRARGSEMRKLAAELEALTREIGGLTPASTAQRAGAA